MVFREAPRDRSRETEPRTHVTAQFAFFQEASPSIVSSVEKSAERFFSPNSGVRNVFAIDGSFLRGFDYPHFWKWYELSGKSYFDGYMQHGKTGADGEDNPLTETELNEHRKSIMHHAELAAIYPQDFSDTERYEIFFYSTLLMLDRLSKSRNFSLAVEPLQGSDLVRLYRANRDIFKDNEGEETGADEALEPEELLREFVKQSEETYPKEAALYRQRNGAFDAFLHGVITAALESGEETRIFVPREHMSYLTDYQQFADRSVQVPRFDCNDVQFVDGDIYALPQQRILAKFINEEHATVTRDEAVAALVAHLISIALPAYGMGSVSNRVPEVVHNATPDELEIIFRSVGELAAKDEDWGREIMDFFGMKTSGMPAGSIFKDLRRIFHQKRKENQEGQHWSKQDY